MFSARLLVTGLAMAIASTTMAGQQVAAGDFNGDGRADLAIGAPYEDLGTVTDAGVVHVIYGRGAGLSAAKDDFWNQNKAGIPDNPEAFDRFGRTLAAGDFNGDGFDDLAIGTDEDGGAGSVHILYGAANGLVTAGTQVFNQSTGSGGAQGSFDGFGGTLAVGDFDDDGYDDLAVGEPSDQVYLINGAGSVNVLYGSANRLGHRRQWWHQQVGLIGEKVEAGDNFGNAIAAGDFNGDGKDDLAIGVPNEDVGSVSNAGIVQIIFGSSTGLTDVGNEIWKQNSEGVADLQESGDAFGASLAAGDFDGDGKDDLAIGVPFEKIDGQVHAGAVHVLYGTGSGLTAANDDFWHQNRSGIDNECETDDEFGVALAAGDFNADGRDDLVIGIRGEGIEGGEEDITLAGAIEVLYGTPSGLKTNFSQFWDLSLPSMPGEPDGARFGSCLAVGDFDANGFVDLAVTAPAETLDAVDHAGAAHILYGSATRLTAAGPRKWWHQSITGIADECETDDYLGGTP